MGAGNVGATCAQRLAERDYAEIVLLDIVEGLPQGKALDVLESAPICGFNSKVTGTNSYDETAGSDIVVITSGSPRKPGMTRDDLLRINMGIVSQVAESIAARSPECLLILVTNPVEAMAHLVMNITRFPRNRVLGLSGVLDGARLSSFIAAALSARVETISTCVLGQHGESMLVIPRLCTVDGKPLTELLPGDKIEALIQRTVGGGAEIVKLLKTGSAFYAPSAAVARIVDSIVLDRKDILSCSAYLEGEYGIKDAFLTVPVRLGKNGIEQVIELELTLEEKARLGASARAVREVVGAMKPGRE